MLHIPGLYAGNLPVTDEFPAQRVSNAENVSIWWRHYEVDILKLTESVMNKGTDTFKMRYIWMDKWKNYNV